MRSRLPLGQFHLIMLEDPRKRDLLKYRPNHLYLSSLTMISTLSTVKELNDQKMKQTDGVKAKAIAFNFSHNGPQEIHATYLKKLTTTVCFIQHESAT